MIAARPSRWYRRFLTWHAERRFKARFEAICVSGIETLRHALAMGPVVIVSNHVAFWDGLFALLLTQRYAKCDGYALMDSANLQHRPFLGRLGAIGVDLTSPRDGAAAVRYCMRLLERQGRALWIFPQGRHCIETLRPLAFKKGAALVASRTGCKTVPVALRYAFGNHEKPTLLVAIGEPIDARDVASLVVAQEMAVTKLLDGVETSLCNPSDSLDFAPVLKAQKARFSALLETILARVSRP